MSDDAPRYKIAISDTAHGVLSVTLRGVLDVIGDVAASLHWHLLSLWAVGELPGSKSIIDYAQMAGTSEGGLPLEWNEVLLLADHTDQIIDGEFIGYDSVGNQRLVIRAVDSTAFEVESNDEHIVRCLEQQFSHTLRYGG